MKTKLILEMYEIYITSRNCIKGKMVKVKKQKQRLPRRQNTPVRQIADSALGPTEAGGQPEFVGHVIGGHAGNILRSRGYHVCD